MREERLGDNPFCLFCGYACLEGLTQVTRRVLEERGVPRELVSRLLEEHHIFGKAYDSEALITLCLNCHREITEAAAQSTADAH